MKTEPENDDPETQAIIDMVKLAAEKLGEHVDCVQIFVSFQPGNSITRTYEFGCGSIHARMGQIQEWLIILDEYSREWARRKQREEL